MQHQDDNDGGTDDEPTREHCPECSGTVKTASLEHVCTDCGLVLAVDALDRGPEWRSFEDDDVDRKRTGAPLTRSRHDRGLSSEIGFGSGARLNGRKRRQLARLRREHNRARIATKADRNKVYAFSEIRRIVSQLSLPLDTRDQACTLFSSAQREDLIRGRSLEGFAAAVVYATCRTLSLPRTIDEIVGVSRADESELKAAYDALNRELGLPTGPIDPGQYMPRYASRLDLSQSVERRAREYLEELSEANRVSGRNPSGVAAGCLYAAAEDAGERVTQSEVADVADVSPVTVRSTVKAVRTLQATTGDDRSPD